MTNHYIVCVPSTVVEQLVHHSHDWEAQVRIPGWDMYKKIVNKIKESGVGAKLYYIVREHFLFLILQYLNTIRLLVENAIGDDIA
jgi:hypothetical protein